MARPINVFKRITRDEVRSIESAMADTLRHRSAAALPITVGTMSVPFSDVERRTLRALLAGPLDLYQLAADLAAPPFVVRDTIETLEEFGFVSRERDRDAWSLTAIGRRQLG